MIGTSEIIQLFVIFHHKSSSDGIMMIMTMAMMAEVEGEALVKLIWTDELLQAGGTRNATTWGTVLEPQMMGIFQHQNPGMSRKCPSSA